MYEGKVQSGVEGNSIENERCTNGLLVVSRYAVWHGMG